MTHLDEFNNTISYFLDTVRLITPTSIHKITATFIGIYTNISGKFQLHVYVLLFPFSQHDSGAPYNKNIAGLYLKDVDFFVDEDFYLWLYDEMKQQNGIVMLNLCNNVWKVVNGSSDLLITSCSVCSNPKEWMNVDFNEWYNKSSFNNIFNFKITNPYLYRVPFPVKTLVFQNGQNSFTQLKLM